MSCARDDAVGLLNALPPGSDDPDDVAPTVGAQETGFDPTFEDRSPIQSTMG